MMTKEQDPPESETVLSLPTVSPGPVTLLDGKSHPQMPGAWSEAWAAQLGHQGVTLTYGPQAGGQNTDPQTHVATAAPQVSFGELQAPAGPSQPVGHWSINTFVRHVLGLRSFYPSVWDTQACPPVGGKSHPNPCPQVPPTEARTQVMGRTHARPIWFHLLEQPTGLHVCLSMCVSRCVCVCMESCVFVCICARTHLYKHVCVFACMFTSAYRLIHVLSFAYTVDACVYVLA